MPRVVADCREFPSEMGCTLTIAGELDEVMRVATEHAISTHGHEDTPRLREDIRGTLHEESAMPSGEQAGEPVKKSFTEPDEHRPFHEHGYLDVVNLEAGVAVGRAVFEPGWRWSDDVKPIAGTSSCEAAHTGYVVRGRMAIRMDDGTEMEVQAGDAFQIPPGHDAWVEGDEPCEMVDVTGYAEYAKPREADQ